MKILIRLPNWLGDVVMSTAFLNAVHLYYVDAEISVIIKKGLEPLLIYTPFVHHVFVLDKQATKGIIGKWKFARCIKSEVKFDLFFCLPESFSSAFIGFATGAKQCIGYAAQMRSLLLTKAYAKPKGLHRVEEYMYLLEKFTGSRSKPFVNLNVISSAVKKNIIININSEASSRKLPFNKAISIIDSIAQSTEENILLIGSPKEKVFIENVHRQLKYKHKVINVAGNTLPELVSLICSAKIVISTDSGPAHIANACNIPLVVLQGAGNEAKTAPYNKPKLRILRLNELSCEPCEKNTCKFGEPVCLIKLNNKEIVAAVQTILMDYLLLKPDIF